VEWRDIGAAVALMLVFEGMLPFLDPARFRRTLAQTARMPDALLRRIGLAAMLGGLALLYLVR